MGFCLDLDMQDCRTGCLGFTSSIKFLKESLENLFSVPIKRHQNIGVKFLGVIWNQQHGDATVTVFFVSAVVLEALFSPIFLCASVIYLFLI